MASKFVFLQLSKSMDWLKSGLDWFKSVRESSLDSADDASDRRGSSGGGDSRLECNLDQIQSHLWPPSPPEKMEGNNYHQWRYASDEKMGGKYHQWSRNASEKMGGNYHQWRDASEKMGGNYHQWILQAPRPHHRPKLICHRHLVVVPLVKLICHRHPPVLRYGRYLICHRHLVAVPLVCCGHQRARRYPHKTLKAETGRITC